MATTETRRKILEVAVALFNTKGVSDTTLRDISEKAGISIGNLAYHFKNKDAIILELYRQMEEERTALLSRVQHIPSFENIHEHVLFILQLSLKYKFFYLSTLYIVRSHPTIAKLHRDYINSHVEYINAMLDYSVGTGNLKPETEPGYYARLSEVVWSVLHFWLLKEEVRGSKTQDIQQARKAMWDLVYPHLTDKGRTKIDAFGQTGSSKKISAKQKAA